MVKGGLRFWVVSLILSTLTIISCSSSEIEKAFGSNMKSDESGKVIARYCVSCHQHKDFSASSHNEFLKEKISAEQAGSSDCRNCHTYGKNWLFDVKRGTHRMRGNG